MSLETLPAQFTNRYEIDLTPTAASGPGRNFFIFLDGTWNEERCPDGSEQGLSNVRRLYDALSKDSPRQIARYFRGVGNRQDNSWWEQKRAGFNGLAEAEIRLSALATINKEYQPGDRLHIFGFSRGAACARRLAAQLGDKGLHKIIYVTTTCSANRLTRQIEARFSKMSTEGNGVPLPVSFLGCWDTVGAFVFPLRFPGNKVADRAVQAWVSWRQQWNGEVPFHDLKISPAIKRAVHCVAIDETRDAFLPVLMAPDERIEEVWFPGVHADVGGGYARNGLSRMPLAFMINRFEAHVRREGLHPVEWNERVYADCRSVPEAIDFDFHFHGLKRGPRLYGKSMRCIRVRDAQQKVMGVKPKIHWSVAQLWQSERVYAEQGKRHWRVDYRPFNITELNQTKKILQLPREEWPFEWVDRPEGDYV